MFVHVDFAVVFQLFCIVQGLTTAAYLLLARPRMAAGKWLGLLLLGLTLQVIDYFLSRSGVYYRNRWLYFTPLFFSWSFGPLLLAYVRARYAPQRAVGWRHLVPGAGQALFYVLVSLQSFDTKTWFWLEVHKPVTRYLEHYGAVLSMLVYLRLALGTLAGAGSPARRLRRLLLGLAGFYGLVALDPLVNSWYLPAGAPRFYLSSLVLPGLVYGLALLAWLHDRSRRVLLPTPAPEPAPAEGPPAPPPPVATAPALPPDAAQLARVVQALEQEELFRNPELTLDALAQHLSLTPNTVSQLLNAGLGQSFHDLVNGYRLAEVKRRLLTDDARRLTVLALALEAGFNSKTTFNRVFKEKTGVTPKEYQKKYHPTRWDDSVAAPG
ncbi:AraC-type DNA-binding protein [Hymenobacter daecheongensis DSM 21074]|uniref:AraC-type DNA-binding protein n=1 Tax=Hymenobacter daecheongensis DSM 21074 TaxID=1121955 RepID=A0A1M6GNF3_9BACT|nr:AraC family transcriptional regulator [Hymenobacter daecheongensis]SHJ11396.1 AraC-type DNA-binding protein [Hymenobacter daecheongensis DSM 21074]